MRDQITAPNPLRFALRFLYEDTNDVKLKNGFNVWCDPVKNAWFIGSDYVADIAYNADRSVNTDAFKMNGEIINVADKLQEYYNDHIVKIIMDAS